MYCSESVSSRHDGNLLVSGVVLSLWLSFCRPCVGERRNKLPNKAFKSSLICETKWVLSCLANRLRNPINRNAKLLKAQSG